jgi:cytochrome d ubiquinol oxidase subunit I
MRTENAVSNHSAVALSTTLILFIVMYFAVFGTGVSYILKLVGRGPQPYDHAVDGNLLNPTQNQRPARPLSASPDSIDPTPDLREH